MMYLNQLQILSFKHMQKPMVYVGIIRSGNIYGPADFNKDRLIPM